MRISLILIFLTTFLSAAARTAADFFVSAPVAVMGSFSRNARQEMLINYLGGSERTVQNNFGSQSRIIMNHPELLTVELTPNTTVSVATFAGKRDTVIAIIETAVNPVPDSRIVLYDTEWQKLEDQFPHLATLDFVAKKDKKEAKKADMPEMAFYTITYSPEDQELVFANTTKKYYLRDEKPAGLELMQPAITLKWNGKKFERK